MLKFPRTGTLIKGVPTYFELQCAPRRAVLAAAMSDRHGADELRAMFQSMGIHLTARWFADCASHLATANPGYRSWDSKRKVDEAYLQFLEADMNASGEGCVPPDGLLSLPTEKVFDASNASAGDGNDGGLDVAHRRVWRGRFVLQCDEILNVASSFHDRYSEKRAGDDRTLKLSMTDGKRRIVGYEYRPCDSLHVLAPAGMKVAVTDAEVGTDGMLYLRPENVTVLGGSARRLEEARRRVVTKWSEPNRPAGGGGRDREEAARFAAWDENGVPTPEPRPEPAAAPVNVVAHPATIDPAVDDDEKEGEKKGGEEDPGRDGSEEVERNRQPPEEPKTSPPKGTPPGRVRKRRAVYIPDSDDDPTQSGAVPSLPSRRLSAPGPVASKTAPSASRGPPPEWATNLARSPPFTYIAAFTLLQRRTGPRPAGTPFNGVAVTLHCRCAAVGALEIAADPGGSAPGGKIFRLEVTLDDGTGAVRGELTNECVVRLFGGASASTGGTTASAFEASNPEDKARRVDWLRRFLLAFCGRALLRVSMHDDDAPASVCRMQGPDDAFGAKDVRMLGQRYEKLRESLRPR